MPPQSGVCDLARFPYPFADGSFAHVRAVHVIEHVSDVIRTMEEFHRLLSPGGTVYIATPHYTDFSSFCDPTHRWHLNSFSLRYFGDDNAGFGYYSGCRFREMAGRNAVVQEETIAQGAVPARPPPVLRATPHSEPGRTPPRDRSRVLSSAIGGYLHVMIWEPRGTAQRARIAMWRAAHPRADGAQTVEEGLERRLLPLAPAESHRFGRRDDRGAGGRARSAAR